tara:strand:- start:65065 stop:66294 length:1230 start_codon:yes stop_codon:yes gene_type:complete
VEIKLGIVESNASLGKNGTMTVCFDLEKQGQPGQAKPERVRYVSPFGNKHHGFVGIPTPGSLVLCAYAENRLGGSDGKLDKGYFYLGSVMGNIPGLNQRVPAEGLVGPPETQDVDPDVFVPKDSPGLHGPPLAPTEVPFALKNNPWAAPFQDMYNAKGIVPEQYGMADVDANNILLSARSRDNEARGAYQDHRVQIQSGQGKTVKCVDSPQVEGIIMDPGTRGKEYFIFSVGNSPLSPFSKGEWHMRTHGPVNMYTMANNMHFWVQEGYNLQLENLAFGDLTDEDANGNTSQTAVTNTQTAASARIVDLGHEGYGCVEIRSKYNNVIIEGEGQDSVIRINAPEADTKVIVNTGGTVDIVADQKITIQSGTEIELNAPEIDINANQGGAGNVYIDGNEVRLNDPHPAPSL